MYPYRLLHGEGHWKYGENKEAGEDPFRKLQTLPGLRTSMQVQSGRMAEIMAQIADRMGYILRKSDCTRFRRTCNDYSIVSK